MSFYEQTGLVRRSEVYLMLWDAETEMTVTEHNGILLAGVNFTKKDIDNWLETGTIVEIPRSCAVPPRSVCANCDANHYTIHYLCPDCQLAS